MMSCNSTEHDMRAAVFAIIGLIGVHDNSRSSVGFPDRIN